MKLHPLLAFAALAAASPLSTRAETPGKDNAITITVPAGERQTFGGFGASLGNWGGQYQQLAPGERTKLSEWLWRDLKFNTLRLWLNMDEYAPTPGARDSSTFRRCYVDSGIIADARRMGVTTLLLAPEGLPAYMKEQQPDGGRGIKAAELESYVQALADFIQQIEKEAGVAIDVTGLQNEPNVSDRFAPAQIVAAAKMLRSDLDRRGLPSVKIIASEHANCDDSYYRQVDLLLQDEAAWRAIAGVSSHSYNMAATDEAAKRIAGSRGENLKEHWMTEASDNGPEELGDTRRAASLAARFLNDMNHRVTHWIHFLGFEADDAKDNATRIIAYTTQPFRPKLFQKYYTYQQLARAFDPGAVFRDSSSSLEGDMTWTFGKKPRITAAAARNPDGSWSIGLTNYTAASFHGVQGWSDDEWNDKQGGHTPAQSFSVSIKVDELAAATDTTFKVHRTPSQPGAKVESAQCHGGELTVKIAPLEVVTLRSQTSEQ